jgi:hypothetical protein
MVEKAHLWEDQMRTGVISKAKTWLALQTTIWRTLCYPLNALHLTQQQSEKIMSPVLNQALSAMGVCRTYPRDLVFSPTKYSRLGIKHIHTLQEIGRLKDLIHHTYTNSTTVQLYRTSLEYLILELGISTNVTMISYEKYHYLATNSIVKNTWEFLNRHNISFDHDITVPKNTLYDISIMLQLCNHNPSPKEPESINQC